MQVKFGVSTLRSRDTRLGVSLILPAIGILAIIVAYPLLYSAFLSFMNYHAINPNHYWVWFRNYIKVANDPQFISSLRNSAVYTVLGTTGKLVVGMALALLLNMEFPGRGLARGLLMLPWVIPAVSWCVTWSWMYNDTFGVVNLLLQKLHLLAQPINFLGTREWALPACIIVGVWKGYPMFMVMLLAGLQAIPQELYEAARVDGANTWQSFINITLPGLRAILVTAIILGVIWTFNAFNIIWLMTKGGPAGASHILTTVGYEYAFTRMRYDYASATSMITLAILAVFLFFFARMQRRTS